VLTNSQRRGGGQEEGREDGPDCRCLESQAGAAPIVGATKLQYLKEMIGELGVIHGPYLGLLITSVEALNIELREEEIKYMEEPYLPNAILGHSWTGIQSVTPSLGSVGIWIQ